MLTTGALLAEVLAGSWRASPPSLDAAADSLVDITPRLLMTGAAGLGWWRLRQSPGLHALPEADQLLQAYRVQSLRAAVLEEQTVQVLRLLRDVGVEPLLLKGWSVAHLYPEPGLRPYGDIDLYVRPEHQVATAAALAGPSALGCPVDFHRELADLVDRRVDELFERSRPAALGGVRVLVLGPEDQLAHLCLHLLRHGAWRPLWLCDLGAAVEARPADFNWEVCLGRDRRRSDWIACALGLAHRLLGARVEGTPVADRVERLPRWLVAEVLRQWGRRTVPYRDGKPMAGYLRHPAGVLGALRRRWPTPIEATVRLRGRFNGWPRLPFQVADCLTRLVRFGRALPAARPGRP